MKKQYIFLLLAFTIVLSSCSRYGLTTVRSGKSTKATVAIHKEETKPQDQPAVEEEVVVAEMPQTLQVETPETTTPENTTTVPAAVKHKVKKEHVLADRLAKNTKSPGRITAYAEKKITAKTDATQIAKGSWLWFLVVGLIFIIIGAILWGGIGWIFHLIGAIFIIVGLIKLIVEL